MIYLLREVWKNSRRPLLGFFLFFILSVTFVASASLADEEESVSVQESIGLNGTIRQGFWTRDRSFAKDRNYPVSSLWITLRPKEIFGIKLFLDAYTQAPDVGRSKDVDADIREFYAEASYGNLDLKIGRSIIVWGRSDKVNPTDQLSLKRLGILVTDDEDQRTGLLSSQAIYNFGNTRLIGVFQPDWRESHFPLKTTPGIKIHEPRPEKFRDQFALKIDQTGGSLDWSMSFFRGLSKSPDIVPVNISPMAVDLDLRYRRVDVYGADFASDISGFGIRGEFAYTRQLVKNWNEDPLRQKNHFFGTIGVDRNLIENLNLNLQGMYKRIYAFQDVSILTDPLQAVIARQVQLSTAQFAETMLGLTSRINYKLWNETLESEVAFVRWFQIPSFLVRPKVTYAISDHFKSVVGGEFYNGDDNSYFGRFKEWKTVFAEIRYGF